MLGNEADCLQDADAWYLAVRAGHLLLRVRSGMRLGEDDAGELIVDPPDPEVALNVADDGSLEIMACPHRALELGEGAQRSRIDLPRGSRAQVVLTHNVIALASDFTEATLTAEPAAVNGDEPGDVDRITVVPNPAEVPTAEPVPTALEVRESEAAADSRPDPHVLHYPARHPPPGPVAVSDPPPTADRPARGAHRTRNRAIALAAIVAAAAVWPLSRLVRMDEPAPMPDAAAPPGEQRPPRPNAGAAPELPALTQALAAVDALLADAQEPAPAALTALANSLEALLAVAPDDPRIRQRLLAINRRLAEPQPSRSVTEGPRAAASAAPLPAEAAAQRPAARTAIELVLVPPTPRKPMPVPPERREPAPAGPAPASAEPEPIELASFQVDTGQAERMRVDAVRLENERTLRAAAEALERGRLVAPPDASAYALYSRVLSSDPDAEIARIGIRSIREQLIGRVRTALAEDDPGAAMESLEDAAVAGVEPAILAELREEAEYRQRLLDAKTGRPGILFPITELTAIRQDPPEYPRHAPAGAEGTVEVEMTITETGLVRDVEVLGNPPMYFLRATKHAVRDWRFAPVLHRGEPVAVRTSARVTFRDEDAGGP
ncbi:MAG TPA: energy transducer TonB [Pseudomonadales bacterium]